MAQQRWHEWRNRHTTTCPSYGAVVVITPVPPVPGIVITPQMSVPGIVDTPETLTENEMLGDSLILHGTRPDYDYESDREHHNAQFRGLSVHMAFNGAAPVEPGRVGLLTWDLPTWAAMEDPNNPQFPAYFNPSAFGSKVFAAQDWRLICRNSQDMEPNTGYLYVLGFNSVSNIAFVGAGVVFGGEVYL